MLIREAVQCPEEDIKLGKLEGFQGLPICDKHKNRVCDFTAVFNLREGERYYCIPGLRSKMQGFDI